MTAKRRLDPLAATLADVVCWLVFYLDSAGEDELKPDVASNLSELIADKLRELSVSDRLLFLEHAANRARASTVHDYQMFLLDMAETLGLE